MSKKIGIVFVILGTALILSALSLYLYNQYENAHAGQMAESMLTDVQTMIADRGDEEATSQDKQSVENLPRELPIVQISGYEYVGYISIPELKLNLPVMSEWDYAKLKIAPCCQFGSSRSDDLVIAAHNYKKHFGYLERLQLGDAVSFTDMDGIENLYEVVGMGILAPAEVDAVQNSGHDLVLYTCTYGGKTRVTVFCDRQTPITPCQ